MVNSNILFSDQNFRSDQLPGAHKYLGLLEGPIVSQFSCLGSFSFLHSLITWFYHFNTLSPTPYLNFPASVHPYHQKLPILHWSYPAHEKPQETAENLWYVLILNFSLQFQQALKGHAFPQLWPVPAFITALYNFTSLSPCSSTHGFSPPLLFFTPGKYTLV